MKITQFLVTILVIGSIVIHQNIYAGQTTRLEVKVVCTNNSALDDTQAQTHLAGSKIIGQPFDLSPDTKCSIITIKDSAASKEEIEEATLLINGYMQGTEI